MYFLLKSNLILSILLLQCRADLLGTFFKTRIESVQDCAAFDNSTHIIARMNGYYRPKTPSWFLDSEFTIPFEDCAKEIIDRGRDPRRFIYDIRNMFNFGDEDFKKSIEDMPERFPEYVKFVPDIHVLMGPNGNTNETPTDNVNILGEVMLTPSEQEATNMAYTTDFFIEYYNRVRKLSETTKYIQFNGWHLKNMRQVPDPSQLMVLSLSPSIVIYVKERFSKRIGQNEMIKNLGKVTTTVIFDTFDSPRYLSSARRLAISWSPFIFIILLANCLYMF